MKAMAAVFTFLAFSLAAQAVEAGGWERPIYKASLDVVQAQSDLGNIKSVELVMTRQDGFQSPTGFVLLIDDQPIQFSVAKGAKDACGGDVYMASEMRSGNEVGVHAYRLVLSDRSRAHCESRSHEDRHILSVSQAWQVMLYDAGSLVARFAGEPEQVITAQ